MADKKHSLDALDVARFWKYVDVQHNAKCWPWTGRLNDAGYGEYVMPDRHEAAHRIAYEIVVGPIGAGLIVRHKCDNPACCNPKHLETGSHADNVRDRVIRGRSAIGEDAGRAILTENDVLRIRATPRDQWKALADELLVDRMTVYMAGSGRSWKHMPMESGEVPCETVEDTEPLERQGIVGVAYAAKKMGIEPKRLLGYIHTENKAPRLDLPIGDFARREVYGWSCAWLMKQLRTDIKGVAQS